MKRPDVAPDRRRELESREPVVVDTGRGRLIRRRDPTKPIRLPADDVKQSVQTLVVGGALEHAVCAVDRSARPPPRRGLIPLVRECPLARARGGGRRDLRHRSLACDRWAGCCRRGRRPTVARRHRSHPPVNSRRPRRSGWLGRSCGPGQPDADGANRDQHEHANPEDEEELSKCEGAHVATWFGPGGRRAGGAQRRPRFLRPTDERP